MIAALVVYVVGGLWFLFSLCKAAGKDNYNE